MRAFRVLLLAAALLAPLSAQDPSTDGTKALEAQKYDEAIKLFTQAIEKDPADFYSHFNLGLAYSLLNRDAEAAKSYRKVLELKPGLPQAELNLAIVLGRSKQWKEAIPLLKTCLERTPNDTRLRLLLAEGALDQGNYSDSEQQFNAAIAAQPKQASLHYGLARAQLKQAKLEDAERNFRTAAELDPTYKESLLELAAEYERAGKLDQAIALYQQFPDNPAAKERAGELLLRSGRAADALTDLEAAVAKSPTAANRYALATAYLRNKQPDKALPVLQAAADQEPNNVELRMTLARLLRDMKKYVPAANEFYRVIKVQPDNKEAWGEFAGMLTLTENYTQALAAFDKLQALGGEKPALYFFRAIILDKMKQYEPAMANYEKFLSMSVNQNPDEEFKARQRIKVIKKELSKR